MDPSLNVGLKYYVLSLHPSENCIHFSLPLLALFSPLAPGNQGNFRRLWLFLLYDNPILVVTRNIIAKQTDKQIGSVACTCFCYSNTMEQCCKCLFSRSCFGRVCGQGVTIILWTVSSCQYHKARLGICSCGTEIAFSNWVEWSLVA